MREITTDEMIACMTTAMAEAFAAGKTKHDPFVIQNQFTMKCFVKNIQELTLKIGREKIS